MLISPKKSKVYFGICFFLVQCLFYNIVYVIIYACSMIQWRSVSYFKNISKRNSKSLVENYLDESNFGNLITFRDQQKKRRHSKLEDKTAL